MREGAREGAREGGGRARNSTSSQKCDCIS